MKKFTIFCILLVAALIFLLYLAKGTAKPAISDSKIAELCKQQIDKHVAGYPGKGDPLKDVQCRYDDHREYNGLYSYLLTYTFYNGEQLTIDDKGVVRVIKSTTPNNPKSNIPGEN